MTFTLIQVFLILFFFIFLVLSFYAVKTFRFRKKLKKIFDEQGFVSDEALLERIRQLHKEVGKTDPAALDPAWLYEAQQTTLSTFIHEILHEVKQPLTVILGFLQLMKKKGKNEDDLSDIETIEKHVHRMLNLINQLRTFRPEIREEPRTVRLADLLEPMRRIFTPLCEKKGIRLEVHVRPNIEITIPVGQFQQVLLNLLINAREALEIKPPVDEPPTIRVQVRHFDPLLVGISRDKTVQPCGLTVVVEDNGPGFPQNIKKTLFEPFHTTKQDGAHMGMGLSICKRIIESHHGKIEIASRENLGTKIRIWWPCVSGHVLSSKKISN